MSVENSIPRFSPQDNLGRGNLPGGKGETEIDDTAEPDQLTIDFSFVLWLNMDGSTLKKEDKGDFQNA
jgi:hypothetical protein